MLDFRFEIVMHLELHSQLLLKEATFCRASGLAVIPMPQHVIDLDVRHQGRVLAVYNLHSFLKLLQMGNGHVSGAALSQSWRTPVKPIRRSCRTTAIKMKLTRELQETRELDRQLKEANAKREEAARKQRKKNRERREKNARAASGEQKISNAKVNKLSRQQLRKMHIVKVD